MILRDALKEIVHRNKWTQKMLTEKAGYKSMSAITAPIAKGDMCVSTLIRLAGAAGYDLMLVRREPQEPEYPIRIDPTGNTENGDVD